MMISDNLNVLQKIGASTLWRSLIILMILSLSKIAFLEVKSSIYEEITDNDQLISLF